MLKLTEKYLLALRAIVKGAAIATVNHPDVHVCIATFFHNGAVFPCLNNNFIVLPKIDSLPAVVRQAIEVERSNLIGKASLQEFNDAFLARNQASPNHIVAALEVAAFISPNETDKIVSLLVSAKLPKSDYRAVSV